MLSSSSRDPALAWAAAAALGLFEALVPGATALAQEPAGPGGTGATRGLSEEGTFHVPRAGRLEGGVRALAFSRDGRWLAAGGVDGSVYAIDLAGPGGPTAVASVVGPLFRHAGAVGGVAVVGAGASVLVVSGGDDGVVAWSRCPPPDAKAPAGGLPAVISASAGVGAICSLAVQEARAAAPAKDAHEALLAAHLAIAGGASGALAALDATRLPSPAWTARDAHRGPIAALAAVGAQRVASAGYDGKVRLWDAALGTAERSASVSKLELCALAASRDGKLLAVGGWERGVRLLDAATLRPAREPLEPHRGAANAVLLLGGDAKEGRPRALVTASVADEAVVATALPASNGKGAAPAAIARAKPPGSASALAAHPDGARFAVGTFQGDVLVYRLGEAEEAPRAR